MEGAGIVFLGVSIFAAIVLFYIFRTSARWGWICTAIAVIFVLPIAVVSCGSDGDEGLRLKDEAPAGDGAIESPTDTIEEEEPNSEEEPFPDQARQAKREKDPAPSPAPPDPSPNDYTEDPDVPVTTEKDPPRRRGGCGDGTVRGSDGKCPNSGESAFDPSGLGGPGANSAPRRGDQYPGPDR